MEAEIERKFLVTSSEWKSLISRKSEITQTMINRSEDYHTRVRLISELNTGVYTAYLTVKSNSCKLEREEVEMEIPIRYARHLIRSSPNYVEVKVRHWIKGKGSKFTIDEIEGKYNILEVEFQDTESSCNFTIPEWAGEEVTGDLKYYFINGRK